MTAPNSFTSADLSPATKPMAWQEQCPANSLDEWVNESWIQGEVVASHNFPLLDKKAPRAEPEEDIDIQDKTQEILRELVPQLSETTQAHEESEKFMNLIGELPPSPLLSVLLTEECLEKEIFFSLEGEVTEMINDVEIISNPIEDCMSPDSQTSQEWPQTPQLTEPVDKEEDSTSEEMTGDTMTTEENLPQLNSSLDVFNQSEPQNNISGAAADGTNSIVHHFHPDTNKSDDVCTVGSPPFADESEEEEEMTIDVTSCQQQWSIIDIRSKHTYSASATSVLTAVTSAKQQEELLSRCEPAPKGTNQEASQQVFSQSTVPLSHVAMERSNQGGAASQGSGCVVTVRERQNRAGKRTQGENETGAEEGQKESGLEKNKAFGQPHGGGLLRYLKTVQIQAQKTEKYNCGVSSKHIRHTRMECDSCDDSQSDSGVSADFSPCSTLEGSTSIPTGCTMPATVPKETPIEREIRRAIEREQSLRRSRGLPNPPTSPEYVDIPLRKTVLSQSLPAKSERCQGKDRQFAGKKMQHEIHEEAQREQDLVKLGKVPGFYDKGTVRQLKEKKQLFEAFQKPSDSTVTISCRSKPMSWSSASDISTLENQEDISTPASTLGGSDVKRRQSLDLLSPTKSTNSDKTGDSASLTPQGPGLSEGTSCQVIILENNLSIPAQRLYHTKPGRGDETAVDSGAPYVSPGGIIERVQEKEEEEEMAPKENPFFKLRSSTNLVKVEQDIREAQEREKELRKQRISLYGGTGGAKEGVGVGGGSVRGSSMEGRSPKLSSSSLDGLTVPGLPGSSSRGGSGSPAARQLVGKISVWPPAQAEEEKINRPEVFQSPRAARQKTPLVLRWESGLVNGHNKEDDD